MSMAVPDVNVLQRYHEYRVLQCKNYKRIFKPKFKRVDNTMAKKLCMSWHQRKV